MESWCDCPPALHTDVAPVIWSTSSQSLLLQLLFSIASYLEFGDLVLMLCTTVDVKFLHL